MTDVTTDTESNEKLISDSLPELAENSAAVVIAPTSEEGQFKFDLYVNNPVGEEGPEGTPVPQATILGQGLVHLLETNVDVVLKAFAEFYQAYEAEVMAAKGDKMAAAEQDREEAAEDVADDDTADKEDDSKKK